ncbi:MAG: t-SNARE [Benniella sp.]|nr:MAG: t-SNARE [Benniella sp.]
MSRDRLNDFNSHVPAEGKGHVEYAELAPLQGNSLDQYFKETELIQSKIQQFQTGITEVEELFTKSLAKADAESSKLVLEKTRATNKLSTEIYDRLRALTTSNMKVRSKEEYEQRKPRTLTLSRQFQDAITRFQNVQHQNGQKSKENVARQYRIANPAATDEEIRRLVDEDQGGAFSQQLLQQARGQQALAALNSVQNRQRELHQLQESILELTQLFKQLEHLVSEQDLTFQQIETSVTKAEVDLEAGLGLTTEAVKHAQSAKKKKWMVVGIIVLIIIIILIIGAAQGWFKGSTTTSA